jgi:hypothetical protein
MIGYEHKKTSLSNLVDVLQNKTGAVEEEKAACNKSYWGCLPIMLA